MNNLRVYSLYDFASDTHEGLYLFPTDETAIRGFRHSISQIPFADDKMIVCLGSFDIVSGYLNSFDDPINIVRLVPEVIDDK